MAENIFIKEDNDIIWIDASSRGQEITDAVVAWVLKDDEENFIGTGEMLLVPGENDYLGVIGAATTTGLVFGDTYTIEVDFNSPSGGIGHRRFSVLAGYHREI